MRLLNSKFILETEVLLVVDHVFNLENYYDMKFYLYPSQNLDIPEILGA